MTIQEQTLFRSSVKALISWGWAICFVGACLITYLHAQKKKTEIYTQLIERYDALCNVKDEAQLENEDLQMQIQSQSDPLWIQMTLMKGLGLVPEGQKKVHFQDDE